MEAKVTKGRAVEISNGSGVRRLLMAQVGNKSVSVSVFGARGGQMGVVLVDIDSLVDAVAKLKEITGGNHGNLPATSD